MTLVRRTGSVGGALVEHFFGPKGDQKLTVDTFQEFHRQLRMEILKLEVYLPPLLPSGRAYFSPYLSPLSDKVQKVSPSARENIGAKLCTAGSLLL